MIFIQRKCLGKEARYIAITGRGVRYKPITLGFYKYPILLSILVYSGISIALPVIGVVYRSFLKELMPYVNQFELLTLRNYFELFAVHPDAARAILNSLKLAIVGASIGTLLTTFMAYIIHKTRTNVGKVLDYVGGFPVAVPGVVMGLGFLWTYTSIPMGIYGTIWILIIAYVTHYMTYGLKEIAPSIIQIADELEEEVREQISRGKSAAEAEKELKIRI